MHGIHAELAGYKVPIDELEQHPDNPKEHDEDAIRESLLLNGQYGPIVCQAGRKRILAGHGTWSAAMSLGWTHIAAVMLDVDDAKALKILLRDNRSAERSTTDPEALLALLRELEGDFSGSGYTASDFTDLIAVVEGQDAAVAQPVVSVSTDLRTIILNYDADTFGPLVAKLTSLQQHEGETFTEVIQRLVVDANARTRS